MTSKIIIPNTTPNAIAISGNDDDDVVTKEKNGRSQLQCYNKIYEPVASVLVVGSEDTEEVTVELMDMLEDILLVEIIDEVFVDEVTTTEEDTVIVVLLLVITVIPGEEEIKGEETEEMEGKLVEGDNGVEGESEVRGDSEDDDNTDIVENTLEEVSRGGNIEDDGTLLSIDDDTSLLLVTTVDVTVRAIIGIFCTVVSEEVLKSFLEKKCINS